MNLCFHFFSISFLSLPLTAADIITINWFAFLIINIWNKRFQHCLFLFHISVVVVKLNETSEWETNRRNKLKELKWFPSLLLWIWSFDCFNNCVTAVQLITMIARYSTPAFDLSVLVSVNLRFRILSRNWSGNRNTKRSNFISLSLQFTAASIEAFRYWQIKLTITKEHKLTTIIKYKQR